MKTSVVKIFFVVLAVLAMAGCLNPIGFMSNPNLGLNGGGSGTGTPPPGAGEASDEDKPLVPPNLPGNFDRDRLGILIVKNMTLSTPIDKIEFISGDKLYPENGDFTVGTGHERSITLEPGDWFIKVYFEDPDPPISPPFYQPGEPPLTTTKTIIKVGLANRTNHLYFYRNINGLLTLDTNENGGVPEDQIKPGDWSDNTNPPPGTTDPDADQVGESSNEDKDITIPNEKRNLWALVKVWNLSSALITKVEFENTTPPPIEDYAMAQIRGGHNRSIILLPFVDVPNGETYDIEFTYYVAGVEYPKTVTLNFKKYGFSGYVNNIYFYKGFDGEYHVKPDASDTYNEPGDGPPSDDKIDREGGPATPPSSEGEGEDPSLYPNFDKNVLGILVVRNVTTPGTLKATRVDRVDFWKGSTETVIGGAGPHFWLEPGPNPGSDMSVLLSAGQWQIVMAYVDQDILNNGSNPPDDPHMTKRAAKTIVQAAIKPVNYCYFYVTGAPAYSLWTGDEFPADYDPNYVNKVPPVGGSGHIKVTNNSHRGSVIIEAKWLNFDYPLNISEQNNGLMQNVPIGTGPLQFRISGKQNFGNTMTATVLENQTTEIIYTDSLEESILQPDYSLLRIDNRSTGAIVDSISLYDRTLTLRDKDGYEDGDPHRISYVPVSVPSMPGGPSIPNSYFEPIPGPISAGSTGSVLIYNGNPNALSEPNYVVKLNIRNGTYSFSIEETIYAYNNISTILLTDDKVSESADKTVPVPGVNQPGSIRVHNAYHNVYYDQYNRNQPLTPDFRIYQFKLYYPDDLPSDHPHFSEAGDLAFTWPENLDNTALSPIYVGLSAARSIPLLAGEEHGLFRLEVIAGSYPWHMYDSGQVINGTELTRALITYDCGEVMISKGYEYQYHFSISGQERDTPQGFVIFYLSNTTNANAGSISYVEMVKPDQRSWNGRQVLWDLNSANNTGTEATKAAKSLQFPSVRGIRAWPYNHNSTGASPWTEAMAFLNWTNRKEAPKQNIVFSYGVAIVRGASAGPFIVPAGEYWCRYMDNYGGGRQYGRSSTQWRYVDLRDNVGTVVSATLDDTTYFVWRGESMDASDDTINPDLMLPWLYPVTELVADEATVLGTSAVLGWKKSSPNPVYTNGPLAQGVEVAVRRLDDVNNTPLDDTDDEWVPMKYDGGHFVPVVEGDLTYPDPAPVYYYTTYATPKLKIDGLDGRREYQITLRALNGKYGTPSTNSTTGSLNINAPTSYSIGSAFTTTSDDLHYSTPVDIYVTTRRVLWSKTIRNDLEGGSLTDGATGVTAFYVDNHNFQVQFEDPEVPTTPAGWRLYPSVDATAEVSKTGSSGVTLEYDAGTHVLTLQKVTTAWSGSTKTYYVGYTAPGSDFESARMKVLLTSPW